MRAIGSCEIFLDEVEIEPDLVLGEVGNGFKALVAALNNERILSAAMALGMLEGVLEEALAYVLQRETFGRVIGARQAVQHYIADIAMWRKQSELLTFDVAAREEAGLPCAIDALIAKVATSEYAVQAADLGIQMLGGMGLSTETHMQRYWRDLRQFRVAPINNEVARSSIAESLGLPRAY
jgi:acyl-CoA dehydrogenase